MLRWRLILGPLLIALLAGLCWADVHAVRPGVWLVPLALVLCPLAAQEMQGMLQSVGFRPSPKAWYFASVLPVVMACLPIAWVEYPPNCPIGRLGWLAGGLAGGLLIVLVSEMRRFTNPGQSLANLGAASLSVLYVGGLIGFLIQLRLLPVANNVSRGGMLALLSMIVVVKATDIGAYFAGHLWGRHKLAPLLSPGKTWEGVVGGIVLAVVSAFVVLGPFATWLQVESPRSGLNWFAGVIVYALLVSTAGIVGDLAESLLKRDAGVKDSSSWLPGFGGVLDLLDSLLVAAPVAYACWLSGLLGY